MPLPWLTSPSRQRPLPSPSWGPASPSSRASESASVLLASGFELQPSLAASPQPERRRSSFRDSFEVAAEKITRLVSGPKPSATFGSTVFNLLKNFLGSSFLSLPDAFKFGSLLPSLLIFSVVASIAASTMTMVAFLCHRYEATSYRSLWSSVVGPRTAPLVDLCICLNSIFSCVSYCLLIGEWLTNGLKDLLGDLFGHVVINTILIAIFALFPLTLLRDLHPLRHTSKAGVLCNILGVSFMVWQACLHWDERIPGRACGELRDDDRCTSSEVWAANLFLPSAKMVSTWNMCASMMMAHYNVPKFYAEFSVRSPYVFGRAVFLAVALGLILACSLSLSGVLRFGANMPDGNVLKHFNEQFPGKPVGIMSNTERILTLFTWCIMSLNIMASFPLLFSPLRVSFLQLRGTTVEDLSPAAYVSVTAGLLTVSVVFGLIVPSLTIVTKFKGAICGMCICYIFPGLLLWKDSKESRPLRVVVAVFMILAMGSSLAVYGVLGAIESTIRTLSS